MIGGYFTRGGKKCGKSSGLGTSGKGKKRKTVDGYDDCCPSRNGTVDNNPSSVEMAPLTAHDIPAIVAAVVKSLREDPAQDTDGNGQPDPPSPG